MPRDGLRAALDALTGGKRDERVFLRAGKAVFNLEYSLAPAAFCDKAKAMGFMSMRKRLSLDASRTPCG